MVFVFLLIIAANVLVEDVSGIGARVVADDFVACKSASFYKDTPPDGFDSCSGTKCKKICQKNNAYATLFNINYKIPLYSAYQLRFAKAGDEKRKWDNTPPKGIEKDEISNDADYANLDGVFDKGHIAPKQYFVKNDQPATMSYSNAVPQASNFNRNSWRIIEARALKYMKDNCNSPSNRYFITGAIPGTTTMERADGTDSGVNVPSYMYTAACCSASTKEGALLGKSFSFAYYGKNDNDPSNNEVDIVDVNDLAAIIQEKAGFTVTFFDGCDDDTDTAVRFLEMPPAKKPKP